MALPRMVSLVVVAGVWLGLVSRASDLLPRELGWVGNLGAVWLAVAFAVGTRFHSPKAAAVAGSATLTLAAIVHYGLARLVRHGMAVDLFRYPVEQWIVIGTVVGALFGVLGSSWRRQESRVWTSGSLAAAFGAEAVYLFVRGEPNAVVLAAPLEVLAFLALPLMLVGTRPERVMAAGWSLALTPLGAAAILGIVAVARRVY